MARDRPAEGTVSALVLRVLVFGAMELGLSPPELARAAGIPAETLAPEVLADPDARVPASALIRLWEFLDHRLTTVDGPILIVKAWLMSLLAVWVYRRFFERVAAPSPEFETFCRSGAVLGALHFKPGSLPETRAEIVQHISALARIGAPLGGWPWLNYAFSLQVDVEEELVLLHVVGCSLLRTRETPPPSLIGTLAELKARLPEAVADVWIHAGLHYGGARHDPQRAG